MNRKKILLISGGCIVVVILCVLIAFLCKPESQPTDLTDPTSYFQEITNNTALAADHAYSVDIHTVIQVAGQEFIEDTDLTLVHQYRQDGSICITTQRNVQMGNYSYSCKEYLEDGMLCLDINGGRYIGEYKNTDPYPPLLLLSQGLYGQVTGNKWNDEIAITLTDATAAEPWAIPTDATFVSGSGSLTATADKVLQTCTYTVTYTQGTRRIIQTFQVTPLKLEEVTLPKINKDECVNLTMIEAPLLLEQMSGYLLQTNTLGSTYDEYIYCQTFGDQRTRKIDLQINGTDDFYAKLATKATLISSSRGEESSYVEQDEIFEKGIYSRTINQTTPIQDASVTQEQFLTHCQNLLVGTVLLPQYIETITVEEDDTSITLQFAPTQELARLLCEEAGQNLYQDPDVLSGMATDSKTEQLSAYLKINKESMLPISSGIHYKGLYTITELPYRIEYATDQVYHFE